MDFDSARQVLAQITSWGVGEETQERSHVNTIFVNLERNGTVHNGVIALRGWFFRVTKRPHSQSFGGWLGFFPPCNKPCFLFPGKTNPFFLCASAALGTSTYPSWPALCFVGWDPRLAVDHWFSEYGPQSSSITWEFLDKPISQPRPTEWETLGMGPSILGCNEPCWWPQCRLEWFSKSRSVSCFRRRAPEVHRAGLGNQLKVGR